MPPRHFILLIIALLFYKCSNAQFILAGQHDPNNDYYVLKDTVIEVYYDDSASYSLDVNGDGVTDCTLKIELSFGFHQWDYNYDIIPQNSAQIAWYSVDTCFYDSTIFKVSSVAKSFPNNDSINRTAVWKNSELALLYLHGGFVGPSCSTTQYNFGDTGFVGVRVFTGKDTVYGWIRITWADSVLPMLKVTDYACNLTGKELQSFAVYPNPSTGLFTFRASWLTPQASVKVYNMLGQMVYYSQLSVTNSAYTINLSSMEHGIYFYKLISGTGNDIAKGKRIVK
jgi:hypothetical protein